MSGERRLQNKYWFAQATTVFYEQYELYFEDDGTWRISCALSEPAGPAGGWNAHGTWTRTDDVIEMLCTGSDPATFNPPSHATLVEDGIAVDSIGVFWPAKDA